MTERLKMKDTKTQDFVATVMKYYTENGRHNLPWRHTKDVYRILVSEMMLQQTQVERVIPKYEAFLRVFPDAETLARVELSEVYAMWQGLGYNRRARFLRDSARAMLGKDFAQGPALRKKNAQQRAVLLESLPGVGPYTARAVSTFAYNEWQEVVETNVRACIIHHFFQKARVQVDDEKVQRVLRACIDVCKKKKIQPRDWYSAMMDYGTHLKQTVVNPSRKSATHVKQKAFKGSVREVRGALLRLLGRHRIRGHKISGLEPSVELPFEKERVEKALVGLVKDGMVVKKGDRYRLAE